MHRMTFQFGSEFEANQRFDPLFQRAMGALTSPLPAATLQPKRSSFEARMAAISGARHAG